MYFCWAYEQKQIAVFSMGQSDTKHLHTEILGLLAFAVCCCCFFIVGGRLTVSDQLPCCIDFPEYFVKSLEYRFD